LGAGFDSFGDHADAERVTEFDRGVHDCDGGAVGERVDQGAVEFDDVYRGFAPARRGVLGRPIAAVR